jgi:hypothetical protein
MKDRMKETFPKNKEKGGVTNTAPPDADLSVSYLYLEL